MATRTYQLNSTIFPEKPALLFPMCLIARQSIYIYIYIYICMCGFGLDTGFVTQLWVKPPAEQRVTNPCKHPQLKGAKFFLATTGSCCWGRNRGSRAEQRPLAGLQGAWLCWDMLFF